MTTLREKLTVLVDEMRTDRDDISIHVDAIIELVAEHMEGDEVRGVVYAAMTRLGPPFHNVSRALGREVRR